VHVFAVPVVLEYLPATQAVQAVAPLEENLPAGHALAQHVVEPVLLFHVVNCMCVRVCV